MKDSSKTKQALTQELAYLKERITELEQSESERKREDDVLRMLAVRNKAILAAVPDIIMEVDGCKRYTWANQAGMQFFGEDVVGREASYYFEGEQETYNKVQPLFDGVEDVIYIESWQRRKDGEKRLLSWWCKVLKDKQGLVTGALSTGRDITERKRVEEELHRNHDITERLAQEIAIIAEIGRIINSTMDIDEVYERFAETVRKIIPFDRIVVNIIDVEMNTVINAYMAGHGITDRKVGVCYPLKGSGNFEMVRSKSSLLIQTEDFDEYKDRFPMLLSTFQAGFQSIMNIPIFSKGEIVGGLLLRSFKPYVYTDHDVRLAERVGNQIAGAIANAQLFNNLKKTEKSLRESEGRFRSLVEQAAVGVAEIDVNTGQFVIVNRRLCEMVGRTEEELLATTFQAITHPEDLHLHEGKTRMMLAGEIRHYSLEKRYLRKDGGICWVNITVSPLWKPGEAPGRNITVVEDITERKRMEAEILALSVTDQLTGLHNRRGFLSLARQELKLAERNKSGMLLFFADLDGLKWINDTLGHEEGDKALIEAATALKETFRVSDIVARLGGDEYAVLAIHIFEINSEIVTARLQSLIDRRNNQDNRRYRLSISIGCSYYDPENPCSIDELMASADKLMYEQKQNKKGLLLQGASLSNGYQ